MVAVEVGVAHGGDLAGVKSEPFEGNERSGPAVKGHRVVAAGASQVNARLVAATAAEGVTAAGERHGDGCVLRRGLLPIVAVQARHQG